MSDHSKFEIDQEDETKTFQELGWDSLDVVDWILELESTHNVELKDEDVTDAKTPRDVLNLING